MSHTHPLIYAVNTHVCVSMCVCARGRCLCFSRCNFNTNCLLPLIIFVRPASHSHSHKHTHTHTRTEMALACASHSHTHMPGHTRVCEKRKPISRANFSELWQITFLSIGPFFAPFPLSIYDIRHTICDRRPLALDSPSLSSWLCL